MPMMLQSRESPSPLLRAHGMICCSIAFAHVIDVDITNKHLCDNREVGKVIGGTRGNIVLEYVSGAPNKQRIQEDAPEIFDYDELIKYNFAHLVTPIMENGGRRAMYQLMDLPEPAQPARVTKKKSASKLVIDRTGETDEARYSGLKMTQALDDDAMGKALEETARKLREGETLRKRLVEEDYVMPYAGELLPCVISDTRFKFNISSLTS